MAKRAWTDGPWTAEERLTWPGEGAAVWLILGSNGNSIAVLFNGSQEDARLISAAPDLFEALQNALHALDDLADKDSAMTRGLAALAKAEGNP